MQEAVGGCFVTNIERREKDRAEQREKLSCDMVSMKALAEFLGSSKDRIDLEAVPNWDERSGLCTCPLPTPHSCPALEKAMTLDMSAKAEGFKGAQGCVLLPCLSNMEA